MAEVETEAMKIYDEIKRDMVERQLNIDYSIRSLEKEKNLIRLAFTQINSYFVLYRAIETLEEARE
jgi:hypothetical protein